MKPYNPRVPTRPKIESYFVALNGTLPDDAGDPIICAHCAQHAVDRFGGEIRGYFWADNPEALLGSVEGGHDFALVGGRYIVDPWAKDTRGDTDRYVFDLLDPADAEEIRRLYGDPAAWELVEGHMGEARRVYADEENGGSC